MRQSLVTGDTDEHRTTLGNRAESFGAAHVHNLLSTEQLHEPGVYCVVR